MVQVVGAFFLAIVQRDVEAAADGYDERPAVFMGMPPAAFSSRHVVYPIDAADGERHVLVAFHHREIASWINDLGQGNQFAKFHFCLRNDGCRHSFGFVTQAVEVVTQFSVA